MFPPFPQAIAKNYCLKLISRIEKGEIELFQTARESEERKGQGIMIGSLVCIDKSTSKRVVLYALSGNAKELKYADGINPDENCRFVPSIVSSQKINDALKENDNLIHQLTDKINSLVDGDERRQMIIERTKLTDISLKRVFDLYFFTRFDGVKISLNDIISIHNGKLPPTGTGDCCAPKLLSYAFENKLQIVSMAEVFYGNDTKNKQNGKTYAPCDERCGYILPEILGLEILYRDNDIVVVNKQSGVLSVPGRGEDKIDSIETRLKFLFPECIAQPAVHRLDMETSGILILALNKEAHSNLNKQFESGGVQKKYEALLDGIVRGKGEGHIELKFRLDIDNRPHQIYDEVYGKLGITDWKKIDVETYKNPLSGETKKVTRVEFIPRTGRTHQLRLHSSDVRGLGIPIVGDTLYGNYTAGERLMLHAFYIKFFHPVSGQEMEFVCKVPF